MVKYTGCRLVQRAGDTMTCVYIDTAIYTGTRTEISVTQASFTLLKRAIVVYVLKPEP
jgi:hypothetical protein